MDRTRTPDVPEPELIPFENQVIEEKPKDHPVWGVIICGIVCGTLLVAIQMLTDYHW